MTIVQLLNDLKTLSENAVKDMVLPCQIQKGDTEEFKRIPEVYKMRLPCSDEYKKYAPYEIIQLVRAYQVQKDKDEPRSFAEVRFVFCVYSEDEQEGNLILLNFIERVRTAILKSVKAGNSSLLNVHEPLDFQVYYEDSAPFFGGEMTGTFTFPGIEREVNFNEYEENRFCTI